MNDWELIFSGFTVKAWFRHRRHRDRFGRCSFCQSLGYMFGRGVSCVGGALSMAPADGRALEFELPCPSYCLKDLTCRTVRLTKVGVATDNCHAHLSLCKL